MSGLTYADPYVVDTSAASGSVPLNSSAVTGTPKKYYLKLTGIPQDRRTSITTTAGTGVLAAGSSGWRAYSAAYPQEEYGLGASYSPTSSNFMASGEDVIIVLTFTTVGTLTWAWTSDDLSPHRPYSWLQADQLTPPGGGSITYDGLGGLPAPNDYYTERFYWIEPTTTDPITVSTNEPSSYWEVYRETGAEPFDDYIEYGENLSDGSPDHVLQFVPIPGERYVVYLSTSGAPTKATTYQLTWTGVTLTPPPYVVDNDLYDSPTPLTLSTPTGSFDYDNTGATEDPESSGQRSIYYLLTVPTRKLVKLDATQGEGSPGSVPTLWLENGDGTWRTGGSNGTPMFWTAEAGTPYLVQIYFPDSVASDPWDADGTVAWALGDPPANGSIETATPVTVGAGQNIPIGGEFPGYNGAGEFYKITVPQDGGLNVVVESSPGTYAWVYDSAGTYIGPIPVRLPGGTTPKAWIRQAKVGDVYFVHVNAGTSDAVLRWGVSTPTWHDWLTTDRGIITTEDGTNYNRDWAPHGLNNGQSGFDHLAIRIRSEHRIDEQVTNAIIDTTNLTAALGIVSEGAGDEASFYIDEAGSYKGPSEEWQGYSAWGLENTPPEIGGGGQITETVNNAEFSNTRWGHTFTVEHLDYLYDDWTVYQPVIQDAWRKWSDDISHPIADDMPEVLDNGIDWIMANLDQYAIEYNTPDGTVGRPVYNLYRVPPQITWRKQVNTTGVWGSMYEGKYTAPESILTRLYEIPWSYMGNDGTTITAWNFFPEKMMPHQVIHTYTVPASMQDEYKEPDGDDTFGEVVGVHPYNGWDIFELEHLIEEDVFPDLKVGDKIQKAYGLWTSLWFARGGGISHAQMADTFRDRWGTDESDVSLHVWPFFWYKIEYYMAHGVARQYPSEYRVGTFAEDFSPLTISVPPLPGAEASVADAGEYSYMGDVGVGVAPPVLWFVYQKWGFLGQHFVAYGHGLGDIQPALNGKLWLGPGPPSEYPVAGEFRPQLVEWNVYPAGPNAYDGTGVMFPGTSVAPPKVDVEHQIIEFIVPTGLTLTDPTEYHLYVVNDNGTSNALSLMLYPMIDLDMDGAEPLLMTTTAGMGEHGLDLPPLVTGRMVSGAPVENLEQRYSRITFPYAFTGRIPERAPDYLTSAAPDFELTGGIPTTGLDDPVNVALPVPLRYRPLDSKITPRPDLGTGISLWEANETSAMDWKFHVTSAPYVDGDNVISSRNGDIVRPAMVFPAGAWVETNANFPAGPLLAIAMAVTIFPDAQSRSFILSSFVAGVPDPDTFPLNVYVEGDNLLIAIGAKVQVVRIAPGYIGRRPIILAITLSSTVMRATVVSDKPTTMLVNHAPLTTSGFRLYLGRNNNPSSMQWATMDVLDIGMDHIGPAGEARFWSIINLLDGIYGVMK